MHSVAERLSSRHDLAVEGCAGKQLVLHTSDPKVYKTDAMSNLCEFPNVSVVLGCQAEFDGWICGRGEFSQVRTVKTPRSWLGQLGNGS